MKLISCHDGKLHALEAGGLRAAGPRAFRTGLAALDALPPGGAFARGAVHELLTAPSDAKPLFLAALLARGAGSGDTGSRDKETRGQGDKERETGGTASFDPLVSLSPDPPASSAIVWSDPHGELYPPALAALGIPLERLFLLHPADEAEQVWAVAECLRCPGVAAVVAALPERRKRLTRVEARRLQLAAERGGGVGLLLRASGRGSAPPPEHAAATRWLVRPEPGERNVQRWRIQLLSGHGGRVGESVILEHHRGNDDNTSLGTDRHRQRVRPVAAHPVHPAAQLADRPAPPRAPAATTPGRRATG